MVQSVALIDNGATSCFISLDFVHRFNIPIVPRSQEMCVQVIDGKKLDSVQYVIMNVLNVLHLMSSRLLSFLSS